SGDGDGEPGDGDGEPGDGDGDPGVDIEQLCADACEVFEGCLGPYPECVAECVDHHGFEDRECLAKEIGFTQCLAGLDCEELAQVMDEEPPFPCQAELEATCGSPGGECLVGVGQSENPGECSISVTCDGEPERSVECDGSSCTCYVDDQEVGGCSDA